MPGLPTACRALKQRFPHFNSVSLLHYNRALLPPPLLLGRLHTFSLVERSSKRKRSARRAHGTRGRAKQNNRCQALEYSVRRRTVVILMKSEVLFWQLSRNLHRRRTVIKIPASGCEVMADNRPGLAGRTWSNDCAALFARAWRKRRTEPVAAACCEGGVCDNTTCFLWLYGQK